MIADYSPTQGSCGFGPEWCSDENCIGTCDAVAECGEYSSRKECPLAVCCSRWGFCGTTEEFCTETSDSTTGCQSNCGQPARKKCTSSNWKKRRITYYETWAATRSCDKFFPEDIPVKALTHLNIAFGGIKDSQVTIEDSDMISRIVKLKRRNRGLRIFIAIGGWAFSDPGKLIERVRYGFGTDTSRVNSFMQKAQQGLHGQIWLQLLQTAKSLSKA